MTKKNINKLDFSKTSVKIEKQRRVFRGQTVGAGGIKKIGGKQTIASFCPLNAFGTFGNKSTKKRKISVQNNTTSPRNAGSGLVVVIMITSVMLILAVVLLQRIIPYSREIRNMQEATQAFYSANSQIEIALNSIKTSSNNENINDDVFTIPSNFTSTHTTFAVLNQSKTLPFTFRLFENDTAEISLGSSKKNPSYHTLSPFGDLAFDFSGSSSTGTELTLKNMTDEDTDKKINIEFLYQEDETADVIQFFGSIDAPKSFGGSINLFDTTQSSDPGLTLGLFVNANPCDGQAYCSLKLSLDNKASSIDFTLSVEDNIKLGDLSTVIVADGLSETGEYHSRIIEIKEKNQGI